MEDIYIYCCHTHTHTHTLFNQILRVLFRYVSLS